MRTYEDNTRNKDSHYQIMQQYQKKKRTATAGVIISNHKTQKIKGYTNETQTRNAKSKSLTERPSFSNF